MHIIRFAWYWLFSIFTEKMSFRFWCWCLFLHQFLCYIMWMVLPVINTVDCGRVLLKENNKIIIINIPKNTYNELEHVKKKNLTQNKVCSSIIYMRSKVRSGVMECWKERAEGWQMEATASLRVSAGASRLITSALLSFQHNAVVSVVLTIHLTS